MQTQIKRSYGLTLAALPGVIALGLMNAVPAFAQESPAGSSSHPPEVPKTIHETIQANPGAPNSNDRMGANEQYLADNAASITASGNYVYLLRAGRLYTLSSSGLALLSRKDLAQTGMVARASGAFGANGGAAFHRSLRADQNNAGGVSGGNFSNGGGLGYNISVEGGPNGSGNTANRESTPPALRPLVPQARTAGGAINRPRNSNIGQLPATNSQGSTAGGANETGTNGSESNNNMNLSDLMAMGNNVNVAASGGYVYVLNGNTLYQLRAADMARISRRDLSTIDSDAISKAPTVSKARAVKSSRTVRRHRSSR